MLYIGGAKIQPSRMILNLIGEYSLVFNLTKFSHCNELRSCNEQ